MRLYTKITLSYIYFTTVSISNQLFWFCFSKYIKSIRKVAPSKVAFT